MSVNILVGRGPGLLGLRWKPPCHLTVNGHHLYSHISR